LYSALVRVDAFGFSDRGLVRANNEDHFYVARFGRYLDRLFTNLPEEEIPRRFEEAGYGLVVADGVGGSAAGEVASRLAINTFINLVLNTPDWIMRLEEQQPNREETFKEEIIERAKDRYGQIGKVMAGQADADPRLEGFGTTMTMAISMGKIMFIAHLGDSRAYVLRGNKLDQYTRDHTLAQAMADQGLLPQRDVARHRLRHVLTKSLSARGGPVVPDVDEVFLEDGDCVLLCTDGLTEMVPEQRIAQVLQTEPTAEKACRRLVEEALQGGGKDNVTVVVARYQFPPM
jgi:serine/threonine protein phosphatase PrpC